MLYNDAFWDMSFLKLETSLDMLGNVVGGDSMLRWIIRR